MYNIGDYVKITNKKSKYYNKIGQIIVQNGPYYRIEFIRESFFGFTKEDFIPFQQFQIGDVVQILPTLKEKNARFVDPDDYNSEDFRDECEVYPEHVEHAGDIFTITSSNLELNDDCYKFWIRYAEQDYSPDCIILLKKSLNLNIF